MEIDKEELRKIIDYTWTLEQQMRSELLENFMKLSSHKSEIDKIRDVLINIEIALNVNEADAKTSESQGGKGK